MQTYHHSRTDILSQMSRTSSRISDVVTAAAFGRPEHELLQMAKDVAWEARQLLTSIEGLTIPIDSFISDSPYLSPNVPEGFSTVYAYIAERNPDLMDFVAKPLREIYRRDERAIRALASRRKLPICNVVAPYALREEGVETVTAYPISVIRDVLY